MFLDPDEMNLVALQSISTVLKAGVLNVSFLTIGLVSIGFRSYKDLLEGLQEADNASSSEAVITFLQAEFAGASLNAFVIQSILNSNMLKPTLYDLLRNQLDPVEYLAAVLQMGIVISISAMLTMNEEDLSDYWYYRQKQKFGKLHALTLFGYAIPMIVFSMIWIYLTWLQQGKKPK